MTKRIILEDTEAIDNAQVHPVHALYDA